MSNIARRRAEAAATADPGYLEKRDHIRRAAGRVFHQRGFHATKLNDVAAEAGVDRASLYYYTGSKEQLFRDVVGEAVTANIAETEKIVNRKDLTATEKLTLAIRELMVSFERNYPYLYVFVQEDFGKLRGTDATQDEWVATVNGWNTQYFNLIRALITEGIANSEFQPSLPAGILANCIIGMMNHSNLWFQPEGMLDAEEIASGMSRLLLNGLLAGTLDEYNTAGGFGQHLC